MNILLTASLWSEADDDGDAMIPWAEAFKRASTVDTSNMNLTQVWSLSKNISLFFTRTQFDLIFPLFLTTVEAVNHVEAS